MKYKLRKSYLRFSIQIFCIKAIGKLSKDIVAFTMKSAINNSNLELDIFITKKNVLLLLRSFRLQPKF